MNYYLFTLDYYQYRFKLDDHLQLPTPLRFKETEQKKELKYHFRMLSEIWHENYGTSFNYNDQLVQLPAVYGYMRSDQSVFDDNDQKLKTWMKKRVKFSGNSIVSSAELTDCFDK
ncbi:hypothetical protein T12_5030 [Trichinella patagoniensis]|uniref:Uncharacterized protein n=1 Tax=Trichinella patagoniensis TaxID=990121 RepID=A0A0V1A3H2_9BILA|nr:hypothetical protein T12_5030 [Trichinella patagoniensis]